MDVSQLLLESVSRDGGLPEAREPEWLEKPRREKKAAEVEAEKGDDDEATASAAAPAERPYLPAVR